jgi:CubicO group peptidase (beta-lactamase class C family)
MRIPHPAAFAREIRVSPAAIVPAGCMGTAARASTKVHGPATSCICILVLLLGVAPSVSVQAPQDVGALDAYFIRALTDWDVPGMAVAIVKDGRVVIEKGYGVRERGKPGHVDDRTLFAIASNTKAFTAAAIAALVDQQKVGWDEPVRQYLPRFELQDPLASADLRVRDLLSHRSGLGTFSGDLLWYNTTFDVEDVLRRARYLQPRSPFRTTYGYSNLMFLAAGQVVATASGTTWDGFVQAHFLNPLGMKDTLTSVRAVPGRENVATPHGPVGTGSRPYPWYDSQAGGAAGGLVSSAHDMTRWLLLQLGRGTLDGRQYFSEEQARTMWTPHVSLTISRESESASPTTHFNAYGLGWMLRDYRGRLIASHGGGLDGMYSAVAIVPDERLGIVVLTNAMTGIGDALVMRVIDAYLPPSTGLPARDWSVEGLERARAQQRTRAARVANVRQVHVPGTRPSLPIQQYAGRYTGRFYGDAVVTLEHGTLVMRLLANPQLVADLTHLQLDTFVLAWRHDFPWFSEGTAQFILDKEAQVAELKLDVPNEDFWFDEIDLRKVAP